MISLVSFVLCSLFEKAHWLLSTIVCLLSQCCLPVCAHRPKLPLRLCFPPLLAGDDRQLGCGVCGGWWRATVCFFLPAVWIHRLQTSLVACACESTHTSRHRHTLWLAVTWPFGLCSITTSHISSAALALTSPAPLCSLALQ